jgi:allantoicase
VEIDTAFFNGNHAPEIAVEGAFITSAEDEEAVKAPSFTGWETILSKQTCGPSQRHGWLLDAPTTKAYTHVRLLMYPDGGIARFRLYGTAVPVFPADTSAVLELSATVNGGVATACSDQHFGTKDNLLLPGRGVDMGDGWETKRTRGAHVDWVIVRLGAPAQATRSTTMKGGARCWRRRRRGRMRRGFSRKSWHSVLCRAASRMPSWLLFLMAGLSGLGCLEGGFREGCVGVCGGM